MRRLLFPLHSHLLIRFPLSALSVLSNFASLLSCVYRSLAYLREQKGWVRFCEIRFCFTSISFDSCCLFSCLCVTYLYTWLGVQKCYLQERPKSVRMLIFPLPPLTHPISFIHPSALSNFVSVLSCAYRSLACLKERRGWVGFWTIRFCLVSISFDSCCLFSCLCVTYIYSLGVQKCYLRERLESNEETVVSFTLSSLIHSIAFICLSVLPHFPSLLSCAHRSFSRLMKQRGWVGFCAIRFCFVFLSFDSRRF